MPQASLQPAASECLIVQQKVFKLLPMASQLVCFIQRSCRQGRLQPSRRSAQICHGSMLGIVSAGIFYSRPSAC